MGMMTDLAIAQWQKQAGIEPASGVRLEALRAMSQAAFQIIRTIELEKSGIRDGDGAWHGGDVMGGLLYEIESAHQRWMNTWRPSVEALTQSKGD